MSKLILYHGSENIIKQPTYHGGKETNDYGYGFYCTENIELAREWACTNSDTEGYVNKYELDMTGLKILDLSSKNYSILNWMAVLVKNRTFDLSSAVARAGREFLLNNYYIDVNDYDVVIGYRADDSYFKFAKDFLNNTISVEKLSSAMELGKLGKQIVIISKLAFDIINYLGYECVDNMVYYAKRKSRDENAREEYNKLTSQKIFEGTFLADIIRKEK